MSKLVRLEDIVWESFYVLGGVRGYLECGCGMCDDYLVDVEGDEKINFLLDVCNNKQVKKEFYDEFCSTHTIELILHHILYPIQNLMVVGGNDDLENQVVDEDTQQLLKEIDLDDILKV